MGYNPKKVTQIIDENRNRKLKQNRGINHGGWKGGRVVTNGGYILVRINPDNEFYSMCTCDGYILEHRYVMAQQLCRSLTRQETVHHIDGNRQNNDISNLQLRQSNHGNGQKFVCCDCGSHNIKSMEI